MSKITTETQVSAGGVIYRGEGSAAEVALIRLGERWQLPKGMIQAGEALEAAAAREVQEETGITGEIQTLIERVEYWYYAKGGKRRFHKFVYFYLLRATGGDTANHDKEADEALGNSGERKLGVARDMCAALSVSRAAEARASSNRFM